MVLQDVQADEDEYKKKQEAERAKQAKAKKVQESVDKAREQNARRKMEKVCLSCPHQAISSSLMDIRADSRS